MHLGVGWGAALRQILSLSELLYGAQSRDWESAAGGWPLQSAERVFRDTWHPTCVYDSYRSVSSMLRIFNRAGRPCAKMW